LQEQVLNFIYDSYHDDSGVLVVPEALRMKKDLSGRRETAELKAYRTRNRYELVILYHVVFFIVKELKAFLLL
jgi:hypothetical protein